MNKYAQAATKAVELYLEGKINNPKEAWEEATCIYYEKGSSAQKKSCPRGAFLGLCEEGLVKRVPAGDYTSSIKNRVYAVKAVKLLAKDPELGKSSSILWEKVIGSASTTPNQQMDVVLGLWNNNLISYASSALSSLPTSAK